jgi:hypothetical protein
MCSPTSSQILSGTSGIFYDSGGPTGNYDDSEYCSFTISPACADSIILSFSSFQTESGYDYLRVYD